MCIGFWPAYALRGEMFPNGDLDSLRSDVRALAVPEGRVVGTSAHEAARAYLAERLQSLGLEPYLGKSFELPYRAGGTHFANVVGTLPGERRGLAPILIGAHYDSVIPSHCADDNAAAVAIALWSVTRLKHRQLSRDVVIALFDAEEPPHFLGPEMGSIRFYRQQRHSIGFHAAIIMDLVGHDVELPFASDRSAPRSTRDLLFVTGSESHPSLPRIVRSVHAGSALPVVAALNKNVGDVSDHHVFRLAGVPYLFLSCGRWQHYHQVTDTPDRLNFHKMAKIGAFVTSLCRAMSSEDLVHASLPLSDEQLSWGVIDTSEMEIDLIQAAFGESLGSVLGVMGLRRLESRQDLDRLAARIQGMFSV